MWEKVGCRTDCTTLAGQTKRSVEDVIEKKARRSSDCTIARVGRVSETRSQKGWGNGEQKAKTSKKDWKWQ